MGSKGLHYGFTLRGVLASLTLAVPVFLFADDSPVAADFVSREIAPAVFRPGNEDLVARQISLLEDLEVRYGPYDIRLKEALKGLGYRLRKDGQLQAASEAYKRALHISRINEGLYNESQLAIVERLIDVDQQMGRWEEVNDHFAYLEHVYKKLYGLEDPRLEEGLRKIVAWHFDASNFNLNGNRVEHLRKAHDLLKLRLQSAEMTLSGEDPLLDSLKRNIERSERYLYLNSDIYRELSSERRRTIRDRYLANTD
ncbi:MAG: hypothetical protein R3F50_20065 [Gammaproteobacteria bacterium]|jgi:hypothetical protein